MNTRVNTKHFFKKMKSSGNMRGFFFAKIVFFTFWKINVYYCANLWYNLKLYAR